MNTAANQQEIQKEKSMLLQKAMISANYDALATAVIGGLIRSNSTMLERGVPVLKDIPVVGSLFKQTSEVREKRELLIFVTPRIVNSFANANE